MKQDLITIAKCLPKICINMAKCAYYITMTKIDSKIISYRIAKAKRNK